MSSVFCCIRAPREVKVLDYKYSGLTSFPTAVLHAVRTLEELYLDSNQIKSLPQDFFRCHCLRKLSFANNDIIEISPSFANLTNLEELDFSKNGVNKIPDEIKACKSLSTLDCSVNPIGRLPDAFTSLLNLTCLHLNDTFLEYLPGNFGRLSKLKILELRENHLKTLPKSLSRLTELERLDIGNNEMTELPAVVGSLCGLLELWCDANFIATIPAEIGNLKQVMYVDMSKNRIIELPDEIEGCEAMSDLHLSTNLLKTLPATIGRLSNMTTLKVDDNQLITLPPSIGGLSSLSELDVSANDLEEIPATIGFLRLLRTFIADENFLVDIPPEIGSCNGLTVLSVRSNRLTYLPDEIGRIPRLRVLNLSDNEIKCLPYSLTDLRDLKALWLTENQAKPLMQLQPELDSVTGRRSLTCYLLPQQRLQPGDGYGDDNQSFHPSIWDEERARRQQIHFDAEDAEETKTTTYPKEMRKLINPHMASKKAEDEVDKGKDKTVIIGNGQEESARTSPHRLLKLEKERKAKEKAKINKRFSLEGSKKAMADLEISKAGHHEKKNRSKSKVYKDMDEAGLIPPPHRGGNSSRSYSSLHSAGRTSPGSSSFNLITSTPNAYSLSAVNHHPSSQQFTAPPSQGGDNFGVFASEENHDMYRRRFQYYQRARKNLKSRETASDVGYYHRERRPLLAGKDGGYGSEAGDMTPQRSRGDGYASDLEGYTGNRKRLQHFIQPSPLASHDEKAELQYNSRSRQLLNSRSSLHSDSPGLSTRPPLPPTYNNAVRRRSSRSSSQENFNKDPVYPPPPPYKPPVRDINPDGASNEDVPISPSQENEQKYGGNGDEKTLSNGPGVISSDPYSSQQVSLPPPWESSNAPLITIPNGGPGYGQARYNQHINQTDSVSQQQQQRQQLQETPQHQHTSQQMLQSPPPQQDFANLYEPISSPSSASSSQQQQFSYQPVGPEAKTSLPYTHLYTSQASSQSSESTTEQLNGLRDGPVRVEPNRNRLSNLSNSGPPNDQSLDATRYSEQISQRLQKMGVPGWNGRTATGSPSASTGSESTAPPTTGVMMRKTNSPLGQSPARSSNGPNSGGRNSDGRYSGNSDGRFSGGNSDGRYSGGSYGGQRLSEGRGSGPPPTNQRSSLPPPLSNGLGSTSFYDSACMSHVTSNGPSLNPELQTTFGSRLPDSLPPDPPTRSSSRYVGGPANSNTEKYSPATSNSILSVGKIPPPHSYRSPPASSSEPIAYDVMTINITKNPGLGFSIAGGRNSQGNPFKPHDKGIFVAKVAPDVPASKFLQPGDKILQVNGKTFADLDQKDAAEFLKNVDKQVCITVERMKPTTV